MSKAIRNVTKASKSYPKKTQKYSIIIPCAGQGSRMLSFGAKSLIKIKNNETLIDRQLKILNDIFVKKEIILITGFESEKVMENTPDYLIKIENPYYDTTNVLKSISIGLRAATTDNVIIVYGDLFFNHNIFMVAFNNESMIVVDSSGHMKEDEVGCILHDNYLQHMCYELPNKWAQIIFLTGKELQIFSQIAHNKKNSKHFGFEAINALLELGGKLIPFFPENAIVTDMDCHQDLQRIKKIK